MPEIKHYVVTQTREVRVTANNATDAARIAEMAFVYGQNMDNGLVNNANIQAHLPGVWGNTTSRIQETEINVKRSS